MTEVSIIVPTYNRAAVLAQTLAVLGLQDYPGSFEVLVCDDGSADATPELVAQLARRLPYPLRYLRQERRGFRLSAARNLGIAAAEASRFVVLLDDDMLVPPQFLRTHAALQARQDAVSLGFRVNLEAGQGLGLGVVAVPDARSRLLGSEQASGLASWQMAVGCNIAVRRDLVDRAGPFDETFEGWGVEDLEYAFRMQLLGAEIALAPDAFGWHVPDERPESPLVRLRRGLRADFSSHIANLQRFAAKYPDEPEVQAHVRDRLAAIAALQQRAPSAAGG